jgi:hypothetical protein
MFIKWAVYFILQGIQPTRRILKWFHDIICQTVVKVTLVNTKTQMNDGMWMKQSTYSINWFYIFVIYTLLGMILI